LSLDEVIKSIIKGLELGLGLGLGFRAGLRVIRPCYHYCSITFAVYSYIDCC
jgi:hypothetical protein